MVCEDLQMVVSMNEKLTKDEVLEQLRRHKSEMSDRFGVVDLTLFGSFARDEATEMSDIDVLVRFDGPATSKGFFGVQFFIEDMFDRSVDLVTDKALREELRPYVEQDAIRV